MVAQFSPETTTSEVILKNQFQGKLDSQLDYQKQFREEMEALVLSIVTKLYKTTPLLRSYSAMNSGVWGIHFGDNKTERVIKLGVRNGASVVREQQVMKGLKALGMPTAEIEFTQEDLPEVWVPFTIMPKVSNGSLRGACLKDLPFALPCCRKSGEFIARLSQIPISALNTTPSFYLLPENVKDGSVAEPVDLKRWNEVVADLKKWQITLTPRLQEVLTMARKIIKLGDYQNIAHRDFIPRQVLVAPGRFAVIDWEFAAPGRTFRDMGDFLGGIRRVLQNKENKTKYATAFMNGYCSINHLSDEDLSEITMWESYSSIRVAVEHLRNKNLEQAEKIFGFAEQKSLVANYKVPKNLRVLG
jgi:aminoglycoside phosphotransferase (APT) family kinase protein